MSTEPVPERVCLDNPLRIHHRLYVELHAAFQGRVRFAERGAPPADGVVTFCVRFPGEPHDSHIDRLATVVCTLPDALLYNDATEISAPLEAEPELRDALRGYLALRWCFNAGVDAGHLLRGTIYAQWALSGVSLGWLDTVAAGLWEQVPWERLGYALHVAAKPLGLLHKSPGHPGRPFKAPNDWESDEVAFRKAKAAEAISNRRRNRIQ